MDAEYESTSSTPTNADEVVVGRVGRAHGIRGDVTIQVLTDEPEQRFAPGATVAIGGQVRSVSRARLQGRTMVVGFQGVVTREAAEALRGEVVTAHVDPSAQPEDPASFYDRDLVGLAVRTESGEELGEVVQVVHLPGHDLLSVRTGDGSDVLVPFVAEVVPTVDLQHRLVVLTPPEGLFPDR